MKPRNYIYLPESKLIITVLQEWMCVCNHDVNMNAPISHVKLDGKKQTMSLSREQFVELHPDDFTAISDFMEDQLEAEAV